MFKIIAFLINVIYWLELFIVPVVIFCFVALWLYLNNTIGLLLSILIAIAGIILGTLLAEYVRKRYGLNNFWSGMSSAPVDKKEEDISA